jgi:hypothetical protein
MTKHIEFLRLDDKLRNADRHRRIIQQRQVCQLSAYCSDTRNSLKKKESKPRFRFHLNALAVEQNLPKSPMRVLLCNAWTGRYIRSGGRWTKDPAQARDFRNGWWATVHAFTINPRDLVLHYVFEDERYNLHIPVLGHPKT